VSRQAAAVLVASGRQEWICSSTQELVKRCQELLKAPTELAQLRAGLRSSLRKSELLDHSGLAEALSRSFRSWWLQWLKTEFGDLEQGKILEPWPLIMPPATHALRCPYPR